MSKLFSKVPGHGIFGLSLPFTLWSILLEEPTNQGMLARNWDLRVHLFGEGLAQVVSLMAGRKTIIDFMTIGSDC